jgi:hypothetical protein
MSPGSNRPRSLQIGLFTNETELNAVRAGGFLPAIS